MEFIESASLKLYTLQGASMYPYLKDGDTVIVSLQKKPRIGDVALFKRDKKGKPVAHRILKVEKDCFVTKGDNICGARERVSCKDIVGVALYVVRGDRMHPVRSLFLSRFCFLNDACLFIREKIIKRLLTVIQKCPLYGVIFSNIINSNSEDLVVEKESREDFVFKFYSRNRYIAMARLDKHSLNEKVFYVRFFYRGLGFEEKVKARLEKEIKNLKENNA